MTNKYSHEARLAEVVRKFNSMELEQILSCFSEDVVTRYNGAAPIIGKADLRSFLSGRYADICEYRLRKTIRLNDGDQMGVEAVAEYTRKSSGERVKVVIHEFLQFSGEQICRWDYIGQTV